MNAKNTRLLALVVVMMAVTATLTLVVHVPVPRTGGYIHLGDMAANLAALAFGPWLGALIAGGGMAIADLIGFPAFAPGTLIIHGLQGLVVGYLGRRAKAWQMFVAALAGGAVVVVGYFLYEWLVMQMGVAVALSEVPMNMIQVAGGLVGVPLYMLVVQAYPPIRRWAEKS